MMRLILCGTFLVFLTNKSQLDAARDLHTSASFRSNSKIHTQAKLKNPIDFSPTFMQSRHFHPDQAALDKRELGLPISFSTPITSSYYYIYGGPGVNLDVSNQDACRLTDNFCSYDYQCCSGKCRCVRWSSMGTVSCYKKCF